MTGPELGITAAVEPYLLQAIPTAQAPLTFQRLSGGRSNLTYIVSDALGTRWILRRPPLGDHASTAHNVIREAQLLRGLHGQVAVPEVIVSCEDESIAGAPFIIVEYVDGLTIRTADEALALLDPDQRRLAGSALVHELVRLHRADPAPLGLAGLADRRDYIARQLRRWHGNWQTGRTRDLPDLAAAHDLLERAIPAQTRATVVHGDYRLDNCILDEDLHVAAIVDWELATVGDPLADLAQFLVYWAEPDDENQVLFDPPTTAPGFPTRAELTALYCAETGTDPQQLDYYVAFNWWKIACIVEDVYSRMSRGQMGSDERDPSSYGDQAARLAAHARHLADALRD